MGAVYRESNGDNSMMHCCFIANVFWKPPHSLNMMPLDVGALPVTENFIVGTHIVGSLLTNNGTDSSQIMCFLFTFIERL